MEYPHKDIKQMIFSFDNYPHKIVYFRVPKVASTSILISLRKKYDVIKCEEYDQESFKFAFVRNPFDRLASCFRHVIKKGSMQNIQNDPTFYRDMSFYEFVDAVLAISKVNIENMDIHFRPQYTFIPEKPDYLGKFENLKEDFKELSKRIGLSVELLHENKTDKTIYKDYYTQEIIKKVVRIYKKDFELFDYPKYIPKII